MFPQVMTESYRNDARYIIGLNGKLPFVLSFRQCQNQAKISQVIKVFKFEKIQIHVRFVSGYKDTRLIVVSEYPDAERPLI